ncbi:MAG TPA: bifunctional DNA-formamidopyrimidine glycosylase/DNA-(apurinic or apyrimidinic site) lyase [Myxococcota bacterium]|nr:bifunctional DNA-formamidopyrimidine glycosylase/DNA-(apurinic or apyrimidinic site) lyase [Myxococcota bacterium]
MPELPEVETTRRGLLPHLVGRRIRDVLVRDARLRWPVPRDLPRRLRGERFLGIRRRGKYLLFDLGGGHLLVHLGMSGRLSLVAEDAPALRHDHVDLRLEGRQALRLTDPRRFGAMLWLPGIPEEHALLRNLGLEPFDPAFGGEALQRLARGRRVAVKQFLMNGCIVTGVGNIYASEALFAAGIHPSRSVARIARARWDALADAIRRTLERALAAGGTTLRDFRASDGQRGHFQGECAVYGREGRPCVRCGTPIRAQRQGQRSTFYCPACQR